MATFQGCNAGKLGVVVGGSIDGLEVIFQRRQGEQVVVQVADARGVYLVIDAKRFEPVADDD